LIHMGEASGFAPQLLRAVEARNQAQKQRLFEKIQQRFGATLRGRTVAIWGLAFKPGTDDLREAPSLALIERLIDAGARVKAYDPVATETARRQLPGAWLDSRRLEFAAHQYEAVAGADALALVTEWKPFRHPDFDALKKLMRMPIVFDGRNQYDPDQVRAQGFEYFGIGRT
jgi:UDPglucose 6-dehydrogenase